MLGEKGLFTGAFVCGAVGTGKTSACMHPFAEQLFSWQAADSNRRAAGLVLEVKGDFCHSVRNILQRAGRERDYLEIGLGSRWQWNPLDAHWMDSYSLAYTIAGLMNQLFGKGKEPFWQQASTNLVRNIIELYRVTDGWVTLREVYHCAIQPGLLEERIKQARLRADPGHGARPRLLVHKQQVLDNMNALRRWSFRREADEQMSAEQDAELIETLAKLGIDSTALSPPRRSSQRLERLEAVERWFVHDWQKIDQKLRTSIVEGISVFLGLFDQPEIARVFCPPRQEIKHLVDSPAADGPRPRRHRHSPAAPRAQVPHRVRQGRLPQHARRLQPRPGAGRRRHAQAGLARRLVAASRRDAPGAGPVLPPGGLSL